MPATLSVHVLERQHRAQLLFPLFGEAAFAVPGWRVLVRAKEHVPLQALRTVTDLEPNKCSAITAGVTTVLFSDGLSLCSGPRSSCCLSGSTKMDLRATIRKLADEAKIGDPKKPYVEAALATNGVPVVAGIGGALVIAETGDVLMYDWESKKISNPSAGERIYALAKAAQKHPELEALKPGRPSGAQNCAVCKWCGIGAGSIRMW